MAGKRFRLHWYQVQLFLGAALQSLLLAAPLSFAGNWEMRETAFLHPLWISIERFDPTNLSSTSEWIPFWLRPELIGLSLWMALLAGFMWWLLLSRSSLEKKIERIGNSFGGFALQVILAYFIGRSVSWHLAGEGDAIEVAIQREFFLLLFPVTFLFLARQRMRRRLEKNTAPEEPAKD